MAVWRRAHRSLAIRSIVNARSCGRSAEKARTWWTAFSTSPSSVAVAASSRCAKAWCGPYWSRLRSANSDMASNRESIRFVIFSSCPTAEAMRRHDRSCSAPAARASRVAVCGCGSKVGSKPTRSSVALASDCSRQRSMARSRNSVAQSLPKYSSDASQSAMLSSSGRSKLKSQSPRQRASSSSTPAMNTRTYDATSMRLVGTVAVRRHSGGRPESPGSQPEVGSRSRNQKSSDLQGRNRVVGSRMASIDNQIRAPLGRSGMCVDAPASMTKWACRNSAVRTYWLPNAATAGRRRTPPTPFSRPCCMISQPPFDQGNFGIHTEAAWSHPEKTVRVMFFRLIAQKATDNSEGSLWRGFRGGAPRQMTPWSCIARATFRNPAMFDPSR